MQHKSSFRQTHLGAAQALVDGQFRCSTSCCRPYTSWYSTSLAGIEQIIPGEAVQTAGQKTPETVQTAVERTGDPSRNSTDCCEEIRPGEAPASIEWIDPGSKDCFRRDHPEIAMAAVGQTRPEAA